MLKIAIYRLLNLINNVSVLVVILCIVAAVVYAFYIDSIPSSNVSTENNVESNYDFKAYIAAKDAIKSRLKNPSSANFASIGNSTIKDKGDTIEVISYVDAENNFGAKLRTHFTVVVRKGSGSVVSVETIP